MSGSLLAFFHLCLVSVPFSAPSLAEMNFEKNLFTLVAFQSKSADTVYADEYCSIQDRTASEPA